MAQPQPPSPELKYQALGDLRHLRRSALHSHLRREVDALADDTRRPLLAAFLPGNLLCWLGRYLKYACHRKHPFSTYPAVGEQGVYRLADTAKVSLAGDWGTGTREAAAVAAGMLAFEPDYTIHLGDVYYVGDATEIAENCLGKTEYGYQGVTWPHGRLGAFALCGNHEMYANGTAYFETFLPALGIPASQDRRQRASFFCLENDHWRIVALDTAYNSVGIPVLEQIPGINRIPHVGPDCRLEKTMLHWLRTVVRPQDPDRRRATILLTHHQYYSAFEDAYHLPAQQLRQLFCDQDLLWIWGHEHRWAVYGRYQPGPLSAYGRCIGHGGMPVSIASPKPSRLASGMPLQFFDERVYTTEVHTRMGLNGFLNLHFEGRTVTLDHRDVAHRTMLVERFTAGGNGTLAQEFLRADPALTDLRPRAAGVPTGA
ncbi:MAG TPA: metallophosphoesterase [Terriglobales bacterium]|jgi:hypothetical protein